MEKFEDKQKKEIKSLELKKQNTEPTFELLRDTKMKVKQKLFRHLCCFMKRKNYFEIGFKTDK